MFEKILMQINNLKQYHLLAQYYLSLKFKQEAVIENDDIIIGDSKFRVYIQDEPFQIDHYQGVVIFSGKPSNFITPTILLDTECRQKILDKARKLSNKRTGTEMVSNCKRVKIEVV